MSLQKTRLFRPHCKFSRVGTGADLGTIQILLGHRDLEETTIYLHLSNKHLSATASPLDMFQLVTPGEAIRSI